MRDNRIGVLFEVKSQIALGKKKVRPDLVDHCVVFFEELEHLHVAIDQGVYFLALLLRVGGLEFGKSVFDEEVDEVEDLVPVVLNEVFREVVYVPDSILSEPLLDRFRNSQQLLHLPIVLLS